MIYFQFMEIYFQKNHWICDNKNFTKKKKGYEWVLNSSFFYLLRFIFIFKNLRDDVLKMNIT